MRNRAEDLNVLPHMLADARDRRTSRIGLIFLDARDDVLIKRYSETRRRHPLTGRRPVLAEAIAPSASCCGRCSSIADSVIDTSDFNVHQLRRLIATEIRHRPADLALLFESFAYRRGVPADADFVFDARCLPNPHWEAQHAPAVRQGRARARMAGSQTRRDANIRDDLQKFLDTWLPRFEAENRSYVTICIGCTGGRHRSVYLAEQPGRTFPAEHASRC